MSSTLSDKVVKVIVTLCVCVYRMSVFRVARSFDEIIKKRPGASKPEMNSAVKSMTTRDHIHKHVDISG